MNRGQSNLSPEMKVLHYIRQFDLLPGSACLLVAVSGGPDSVCLLRILHNIQQELGITVHVAHLDHCLRGEESDGDAAYVRELAERLGLECTCQKVDVEVYRREHGGTLEEAAREVRYAFLAQTAKNLGTDTVATGHTRDDNIETILMHFVRGTGTRGLRGLLPATSLKTSAGEIKVIRPLLEISREETVTYCRDHDLNPRQDSSNLSLSPLRNRVRQQLIPLLKEYNQSVDEALLRTSSAAADELDFLDQVTLNVKEQIVTKKDGNVYLDKSGLTCLHPAVQRHLLRMVMETAAGSLKDIETRHIEAMLSLLDKPAGKRIDLPDGLTFVVEYDRFVLTRQPELVSGLPELQGEYRLNIPGETVISGWKLIATVAAAREEQTDTGEWIARFDFETTGDTLFVRARQTADRFQPLGMPHSKKLGDFMTDEKVPLASRDRVPVVCNPSQIIWLAGYRIDDRVKVTPDTKTVLTLQFVSISG